MRSRPIGLPPTQTAGCRKHLADDLRRASYVTDYQNPGKDCWRGKVRMRLRSGIWLALGVVLLPLVAASHDPASARQRQKPAQAARSGPAGLPELSIESLRTRADWLSALPDGMDAVDACLARLPQYDRAALVFYVSEADGDSRTVRMQTGLAPRTRQIICSTGGSNSGRQADIYYPVSGEWTPVTPPYFTRELSLLPKTPGLSRSKLRDGFGLDHGYVALRAQATGR